MTTKKELARQVAEKMKEVRADVDIEKTAKLLMNGMTTNELKKALAHKS